MKIILDIGAWNSDLVMQDLQRIFKFDAYTVSMQDKSITLKPTAWREFPPWIQGNPTNEVNTQVEPEQFQEITAQKVDEQDPEDESELKPVSKVPKCLMCGKKMVGARPNQKYCSHECKRKANYQAEVKAKTQPMKKDQKKPNNLLAGSDGKEMICPECGKKFKRTSTRQIYCCETCRNKAKRKRLGLEGTFKPEKKVCPVCHKSFVQKQFGQKYCSHECKRRSGINRIMSLRAKKSPPKSKEDDRSGGPVAGLAAPESQPKIVEIPKDLKPAITPNVKIEDVPSIQNLLHQHKCELCGMSFKSINKVQRFCKPCLDSFGEEQCAQLVIEEAEQKRAIEEAAKIKFKVCPRCGHTFEAKNPAKEFFCPTCVQRALSIPKKEN